MDMQYNPNLGNMYSINQNIPKYEIIPSEPVKPNDSKKMDASTFVIKVVSAIMIICGVPLLIGSFFNSGHMDEEDLKLQFCLGLMAIIGGLLLWVISNGVYYLKRIANQKYIVVEVQQPMMNYDYSR